MAASGPSARSSTHSSALPGTTATSPMACCAATGSPVRRTRTRSRTVRGTPGSPAASTSVTSSGFPPVSAYRPAAERPCRLASSATAPTDSGGSGTRCAIPCGRLASARRSGWSASSSSSRKVTSSSAGTRWSRRPTNTSRSRVASSAQCASSTTTTVPGWPLCSSSSRNAANTASRGPPAPSSSASRPPAWRAMSCSGPSARGVSSGSQAPARTRASAACRSANPRTSADLPIPPHPTPAPPGRPPRRHWPAGRPTHRAG